MPKISAYTQTSFAPGDEGVLARGGNNYKFGLDHGARLVWDAVDEYHIEPGGKGVNGGFLEWSANISQAGLALANSTLYYIYIYDNGGTPDSEESTTAPSWNSTYRYWQKTGDASRRRVGYFITDGSGNISRFTTVINDNTVEFYLADGDSANRRVVNGGSQTAQWDSFDVSSYVPSHATHSYLVCKTQSPTANDDGVLGISPIDLGAGVAAAGAPYQVRGKIVANNAAVFFGGAFLPIEESQTHYYRIQDSTGTGLVAYIECNGARFQI